MPPLTVTPLERKIDVALDALMGACGFVGESGTERLFCVLYEAVEHVADNWDIVDQSHKDGLCYNVNAMLSSAIAEVLAARRAPDGGAGLRGRHPVG